MCACLDRNRLVQNVALDATCGRQANFLTANAPDNVAVDDNVFSNNLALDGGVFADGQQVRADIANHDTLDLQVALGLQVADNLQVR